MKEDSHNSSSEEMHNLGRLGDYIGFRLRRIQNQLAKDFQAATKKYKLRSGLFSSLALISANPGISQNELCQISGLDKSITVQLIDEMEERKLARRERSKVDRRRHALYCSKAGEKLVNELFDILSQTEQKILHQMSAKELQSLTTLLDRVYDAL